MYSTSASGTDISSDISEAADLYSCPRSSSSKSVVLQDEIKKHEVCKEPTMKNGVEGFQFMGDRIAKVVLSFERDCNFIYC